MDVIHRRVVAELISPGAGSTLAKALKFLVTVSICTTRADTGAQKEPVFLHVGPRWKSLTGSQKLDCRSVVLKLTSPSAATGLRELWSPRRNSQPVTLWWFGTLISCFSLQGKHLHVSFYVG